MTISAKSVMALRQKTQVGMMECKKALAEANGDMALAEEILLKSGASKADKKADRVANEGLVFVSVAADQKSAAVVEVNCETDFVARGDAFQQFGQTLADLALANHVTDVSQLSDLTFGEHGSVEDTRKVVIGQLGENIQVRRACAVRSDNGCVASYLHGGRIAVLVRLTEDNIDVAKDVAMHVAAMKPGAIGADGIPADLIAKEREIVAAQVAESGKPEAIAEKIIDGKMQKFLSDNSLLGQVFVKDSKAKVQEYLAQNNATVESFVMYEIGMTGNDQEVTA